jgi:O-methyltransferase involved in polyketide biosynthesis
MTARDFSTISPSAKALLLVKAQTPLPYAREAAEALFGKPLPADPSPGADIRRVHFLDRARSLDEALAQVKATRVLELASGLSFRGLSLTERDASVAYLDTDLPEMATLKSELLQQLHPAPLPAAYRVRSLDALDPAAFQAAVSELPLGPVCIVHEGLLMYLDDSEKERLAANVHQALRGRGGHWITADVYVRTAQTLPRDERTREFLERHRVDAQKFADFPAAEKFFTGQGFSITQRISRSSARETWIMGASF